MGAREKHTHAVYIVTLLQLYMYKMVGGAPFTRYMYKGQEDGDSGGDDAEHMQGRIQAMPAMNAYQPLPLPTTNQCHYIPILMHTKYTKVLANVQET